MMVMMVMSTAALTVVVMMVLMVMTAATLAVMIVMMMFMLVMVVVMAAAALLVMVMMVLMLFVIMVMATAALLIMVVVMVMLMLLVIMVMAAATLVIMMMVMMLMLFLKHFLLQRYRMLHNLYQFLSVKVLNRSCDDGCIFIQAAKKLQGLLNFLLSCDICTAHDDGACILDLIVKELTEVLHVHLAFLCINYSCIAVQFDVNLILNTLYSFAFEGAAGMEQMQGIMTRLRQTPPTELGAMAVERVEDYIQGVAGLPAADVLAFCLQGGCKVMIRPSGTEPKLKAYLFSRGDDAEQAAQTERRLHEGIAALLQA